jgi:hypothetical protein
MKQELRVLTQMGHLAQSARFQSFILLQKDPRTAKYARSAKKFEGQARHPFRFSK